MVDILLQLQVKVFRYALIGMFAQEILMLLFFILLLYKIGSGILINICNIFCLFCKIHVFSLF